MYVACCSAVSTTKSFRWVGVEVQTIHFCQYPAISFYIGVLVMPSCFSSSFKRPNNQHGCRLCNPLRLQESHLHRLHHGQQWRHVMVLPGQGIRWQLGKLRYQHMPYGFRNGYVRGNGYPSETHLTLKSREISFFIHNIRFQLSTEIVLKFCTEHGNIISVFCGKFQSSCITEEYVMGKRDIRKFGFDMSFGRIPYIAQLWRSLGVNPGSLFTKRTDVLPQDLLKSRSCEIRV